ncbi:MAG: SIR2 family protein [Sphaerotilus natans]
MNVSDFIGRYKNHPILFVGTGLSKRYIRNSYSWEEILRHAVLELKGSDRFYFDKKHLCRTSDGFDLAAVASEISIAFDRDLSSDNSDDVELQNKFAWLNDDFYAQMESGGRASRFKIFLSKLLGKLEYRANVSQELNELKRAKKNIGSIITTNYDRLVEDIFSFHPLVGNNIVLSNPYGSVYKIHGCVSSPSEIIITSEDYDVFNKKHELIKAQLLSLFIHNPIIFLGYGIKDENIKSILRTIFSCIDYRSPLAIKVRENFLLVEHDAESNDTEVSEHDIDLEGYSTIRINKIRTNNFFDIYRAISCLSLPVSAMDIRKVESVVKYIQEGGSIKVRIVDDLDSVENCEKILAIGSSKVVKYEYQDAKETIKNYFKIIDEKNYDIMSLIDKFRITSREYFPIFGFKYIGGSIGRYDVLAMQQIRKINSILSSISGSLSEITHNSIDGVMEDLMVSSSNKVNCIILNSIRGDIGIDCLGAYLRFFDDTSCTDYKKMLCVFDFLKYADADLRENINID